MPISLCIISVRSVLSFFLRVCDQSSYFFLNVAEGSPNTVTQRSESGIAEGAIKASHTPQVQPGSVRNDVFQGYETGCSGPSTLAIHHLHDTPQLQADQRFKNHQDPASNYIPSIPGRQMKISNTEQGNSQMSSHRQIQADAHSQKELQKAISSPTQVFSDPYTGRNTGNFLIQLT